uniref:hypothetical protein n=1 Tax=Candidatus Mycoplasma haematohominis TaxID=1494318 RepID=UPI001C0A6F0A
SYNLRWKGSNPKSEKFKKATSGSDPYDMTALNRICWEVYKNSADNNEKEDAWTYCSVPGKDPTKKE